MKYCYNAWTHVKKAISPGKLFEAPQVPQFGTSDETYLFPEEATIISEIIPGYGFIFNTKIIGFFKRLIQFNPDMFPCFIYYRVGDERVVKSCEKGERLPREERRNKAERKNKSGRITAGAKPWIHRGGRNSISQVSLIIFCGHE